MKKRPDNLPIIVAISLGLHVLLFYALSDSHSFTAANSEPFRPASPPPIQARLVFTPISIPIEHSEVEITLPTPPALEKPIQTPEMPDFAASNDAETSSVVEDISSQGSQKKVPTALVYPNILDLAQQQLSGLHQTKLQGLAQQAARDYQAHKNSPELNLKKFDPFITADQKLRDSLKVTVDCSGDTNKVALLMSGLFGGTLKCSTPPGFNTFIQNRLDKTEFLSERKEP